MENPAVCVDVSFILRLLMSGRREARVVQLWSGWREARRSIIAPTPLYYEVANALHRYTTHGELLRAEATEAMETVLELNITIYGDADLHRHALDLAHRFSLPATYDAHYLALAERLGADFWTADQRLAHVVGPGLPWVHALN